MKSTVLSLLCLSLTGLSFATETAAPAPAAETPSVTIPKPEYSQPTAEEMAALAEDIQQPFARMIWDCKTRTLSMHAMGQSENRRPLIHFSRTIISADGMTKTCLFAAQFTDEENPTLCRGEKRVYHAVAPFVFVDSLTAVADKREEMMYLEIWNVNSETGELKSLQTQDYRLINHELMGKSNITASDLLILNAPKEEEETPAE